MRLYKVYVRGIDGANNIFEYSDNLFETTAKLIKMGYRVVSMVDITVKIRA